MFQALSYTKLYEYIERSSKQYPPAKICSPTVVLTD